MRSASEMAASGLSPAVDFFEVSALFRKAWKAKAAAESKYRNGRLDEAAWARAVARFNKVHADYSAAFNALPLANEEAGAA